MLSHPTLFFCDGRCYQKLDDHFQLMHEEDALRLCRSCIAPSLRTTISRNMLKEVLDRLTLCEELELDLDKMYRNPHLLNVRNGVYDLKKQTLITHPHGAVFDYKLNFHYIPKNRRNPTIFNYFVNTSFGAHNRTCILQMLGYAVSSLTDAKKCFLLLGAGNAGKSLMLEMVEEAVGSHLCTHFPFSKVGTERAIASYAGMKVNISRDVKVGKLREDEGFKSVVSCEPLSGRLLYHNEKTFIPKVKLLAASNSLPQFAHPDEAVWNRFVIIQATQGHIDNPDIHLKEKLLTEIDSIFSEALDTLKALVESNYNFAMSSDAKKILTHEKEKLHSGQQFLTECCVRSENAGISSVELFEHYLDWCRKNAITPEGRNKFLEIVPQTRLGTVYKKISTPKGWVNGFWGLTLKKENL